MEDRHTVTARALLARLQSEPDWTAAIAAALRDEHRATLRVAHLAMRIAAYAIRKDGGSEVRARAFDDAAALVKRATEENG